MIIGYEILATQGPIMWRYRVCQTRSFDARMGEGGGVEKKHKTALQVKLVTKP